MRKMSRGVRGSEGTKKKFLWKWNPKREVLLWNTLDLTFLFFFSVSFRTMKKACDKEVT